MVVGGLELQICICEVRVSFLSLFVQICSLVCFHLVICRISFWCE
uniref:Uncharacterized protein n=1 Tax=Setaria italica TaxID=4555 RepID=K3ZPC5_SETIT